MFHHEHDLIILFLKVEKNSLIQGSPYFTPLRFTIRQYNDILEKTTATSKIKGPDAFRMILAKLEEQFNALPLVDLEADYRKESYSEKFPREAKFAGGEIDSKYPVTSVPFLIFNVGIETTVVFIILPKCP